MRPMFDNSLKGDVALVTGEASGMGRAAAAALAEAGAIFAIFLCKPASRQMTGQMVHTSAGAIL
jgi:NAD(P)-dependent dehydrogenase (short-subunit alcohol dehydrogenase family)